MMKPSNQQQEALDVFWNPENLLIKARAGAGKGLREDQPVVTPSGFVPINQLKEGELVCGTDGLSYEVIGIYDRGVLPLFEVKFNDGQSVITDGDHRWLCQSKHERDHKKGFVIRTTSDLVDLGKKVFLPMPKPIEGVYQELPLDPWLLGALLGDGGISQISGVIFSNHESRMIDAVRDSMPEGSKLSFVDGVSWSITGGGIRKASNNKVLKALRELRLQGCGSHKKFVPEIYLTSPADVRLKVLQGLLDTDGSAHARTLEFSSASKQLALDVRRIVESLGGLCSISERGSYYIKDGIKKDCRTSYRLFLRIPADINPFLNCSHKIERHKPKTKYPPVRQIVGVSSVEHGRSICIQVGSPDQLFLTVGHAITHNTTLNEHGCRSNPSAKIVNLSFNASVKDEAKRRMPTNVSCKTFHGLAWPTHGFKYKYRLKWRFHAKRYAERFGVDPMIVHAARATIGRFNSSNDMIIDRWHVPKEMWSAKPRADQDGFRDEVVITARKLWMMKRSLRDREMPVDFNDIRTMFRLDGCPGIGRYDKVVVDESQDITPCDAAMIARIGAPVVYTGDDCQQLYSWLGSIQNLDEIASVHKYLTESWRFGPAVADAANKVLALLKLNAPPLVGLGGPSKLSLDPPSGKHTVLCRTNAGLMAEALDAVRKGRSIHVVGNLMESVSLLESGYHLSIGDRDKVRHPSLLAIADWNEVEQLKEHDPDLSVLWSQVEKYGSQIPHFCEELREAGEMPAHKADVIVSTVHKCVHPDTFVETPDGLLRIRDIPNHGVIATPNGIAEYQDKFTREECETFVISTRKNYQIEVTGDHGMMVWRNGEDVRVNADQIEVGDLLRVKLGCTIDPLEYPDIPVITKKMDVRTKIFATPLKMSESLGEFLGLMVADGTVFNRGFRLVKRHVDVVDRFGDLIFELFGVKPKPCDHEDTGGYEVCSVYLSEWLKSFGGLNPNDKSIPDIILRSPMSVQSSFLKGLFEDGTVNMKNGGFDHIHFETKYEEMARTVQLMLLRFGIISTVKTRKSKGFPITTVYIYGENVLEFSKKIGFVSQWKNDRLFVNPGRAMKASKDYIPITTDELNSIRDCFVGSEYRNAKITGRISRNKAMAVIGRAKENCSVDAIMFLIDRMRWHYDPVASIKKSRSETMCVTVPFTWRFLQNGFDGFNSKGAQWSEVKLSGIDFPKLVSYSEKDRRHKVKRFEVYIYYVAVTRAIHTLYPNETYFQLDDWLELLS